MSPSRPIAKATREEEKIREGSAAREPMRTPAVMTARPMNGVGKVRCAARARAAWGWPKRPRSLAPRIAIVTKATAMKIAVAIPKVRKLALGMSRFGFRVSSPVCAMISYPSKTMNVRPIVIMMTIAGGYGRVDW